MRIYDIITKKKHGNELSEEEIKFFAKEYESGAIPDYQASALLMAICLKGMSEAETLALTTAIADSGDKIDLSAFGTLSADKHSTGGVGDKTTLIVAPLAATLGCKVAKMSGRGLGHTGGTVDKLDAFPLYRTNLSSEEFLETVKKFGIAVVGQTGNLAPLDKKLYALRDVTATVDSVPLIASSVMGKKLAAGSHAIVLDVKYGSGSFMKKAEDAKRLAELMVKIGNLAGRKVAAFITNMDMPLGHAVGNTLELVEAINTLKGKGPADLTEISVSLASKMASLTTGVDYEKAKELAYSALRSGAAFDKFKEWISAQGGDASFANDTGKFQRAELCHEIFAESDGYIYEMNAESIGVCAMELGAGRKTKTDRIDYTAGIILEKKTGDFVRRGELIATLFSNSEEKLIQGEKIFGSSFTLAKTAPEKEPLIHSVISE